MAGACPAIFVAHALQFYALRGVMGSLGAEIPAGFYAVAETRSPAEGSAARAACLVGVVMQANRVFYAANVVRGWRDLHFPHESPSSIPTR